MTKPLLLIRLDAEPLINKLHKDGRVGAVSAARMRDWRKGGIDLFIADKWCVRLGYHPYEIWGQDFYQLLEH